MLLANSLFYCMQVLVSVTNLFSIAYFLILVLSPEFCHPSNVVLNHILSKSSTFHDLLLYGYDLPDKIALSNERICS